MTQLLKPKFFASALCLFALAAPGYAAITCSASPTGITTSYASGAATSAVGSVSISCARLSTDSGANATYFLSLDQGEPPNGRDMTRQNGTDKLRYAIYRNSDNTGSWTTGGGRNPGANQAGGLNVPIVWAGGLNFSVNIPYYFRINSGINRPAGIYDDVTNFQLLVARGGALLASGSANLNTSIVATCFFNSMAPLTVNYTSFSATTQAGNSNFSVSCTLNTPYTMAVTPASGTLLGLPYTLALSAASGTGSAFPQNYSVTATIPANQSGECPTGACSASQVHLVEITY